MSLGISHSICYNKIMKRKVSYFVSRKNPLTWLSAVLGLCAGAGYIASVIYGKGVEVTGAALWFRVILPVASALLFAIALLVRGKERVYRAAVPFWLLMICFAYRAIVALSAWYMLAGVLLVLLALAVCVSQILTGNWTQDWALIFLAAVPLCGVVLQNNTTIHQGFSLAQWLPFLPDGLFMLAYIALAFALRIYPADGVYHPTWGDRPDGRRVRSLNPISNVGAYIMPDRSGALIQFKGTVEISELEAYIRRKKAEGLEGFGFTEALLTAYVQAVAKYPAVNRFLSGQKVYSRDGDIQFCMVIKKEMSTEAPDTIIKLHLTPDETANSVYKKYHAAVAQVQQTKELDSEFDGIAGLLGLIPGLLLKFTVWLLKMIDYLGLLPHFLLEISPFHGSVFFTSMGSLGIPAIYHHLYDFGNLPVFFAFGCKRRMKELTADGEVVDRRYVDYSFTLDERIVDGFYYATAFKYFQRLLQHPERLDCRPPVVRADIP